MSLINRVLILAFCVIFITPTFILLSIFGELTVGSSKDKKRFRQANLSTFKEFWCYKNFTEKR